MSPVIWALINDDDYIGMTLYYIDEGYDTRNIIFQSRIKNNKKEDINIITDKLKTEAIKLCKNFLNFLETNKIPRKKQDQSKAAYISSVKIMI